MGVPSRGPELTFCPTFDTGLVESKLLPFEMFIRIYMQISCFATSNLTFLLSIYIGWLLQEFSCFPGARMEMKNDVDIPVRTLSVSVGAIRY